MQRIKLCDSVHFNMLSQDKFKTCAFQVCFVVNLERENTTNLSLLSQILLRGSQKYPTLSKISDRLDYLYDMKVSTRTFKSGERLIMCYESDFLKNDFVPQGSENLLYEAIEMFRQLVFCPLVNDKGFDEKYLEIEKRELETEITSVINDKNTYVRKKCVENMCKNERYGINEDGELEDIPKVTGKSLYEFYLNLLKTATVEIFFNGNGDTDAICESFKEIFYSIDGRCPVALCDTFVTGEVGQKVCELSEKMPISQGKLAMGFRTGVTVNDADSAALALFCEIFGASPVSKLFMNVREKLSLCYYCRSAIDSYKGMMMVLSGIQTENKDKSICAIMKELSDVQDGKVTQDELSSAKLSLLNAYKTLDDNPSALMTWFLSRIICNNFENPYDMVKKIENTTLQDVIEVSKKVKLDTVYFLEGCSDDGEAVEE